MPKKEEKRAYDESLPLVRSTQNIISGNNGDAYKPETDIEENGTNDKQVFSNYANKPYSPAESVLEVSLESYPYYHVSKDSNLSIMEPRIPPTPRKYIDTKKPRVHFARSIQQALMSLGHNLTDEEFFVYVPVNNNIKVFTPFINQIPEVKVTGEVWFTQPVAVRCLGKIKVIGSTDNAHIYKLGNTVNELYEWKYKKIDNEESTDGFHLNPEEDSPLIEQANYNDTQKHPVFIVLQHSGTLLSNLIKTATGDTYTHACISFNPELDPIYSFGNRAANTLHADPGFVIQNQKSPFFKNYTVKYAVYVMYVDDKAYKDMQRCLNIFIENRNKLKYDFLNLLSAWFGITSEKSERYFCARFVAKIIDAGYKLNRVPSLWKPEDFRSLNNITLVNQGSNFRLYDPRITRKNMLYVQVREFDRLKYKFEDFPKDDPILMPVAASAVDWNVDGKAINESEELELPSRDRIVPMLPDIQTILDRTPTDRIWLTSDWHLFKNHYKKEANYVNTQEIVKWCREHIKDTDVFMYLGDLSFRYANKQDQLESQKIMAKIPGIKVLILGNHDLMLGQDYFKACGFDYVFESLRWGHLIFTHRPINMDSDTDSESLNIHGHIHNIRMYNTTDGKRNINVYPLFYDNKPANLKYILSHVDELTKDNEWNPNYMYDEATFGDMYDSLYSPSMSSLEIEPISEAAYKKRSFQSNSRTTKIDDDFKAKGHYDLSNYRCIDVTPQVYDKYASKTNCMTDCVFGLESYHKDPKGWQNDVSMKLWLDGDKPVAYLQVSSLNKRKTGGARSIHVIKIDRQYRGYGLSKQIIDYAVKRLKANWVFLMKRNEVGLKIFKDYGFKINAFDKKDYESADRICLSYGLTKWYSSEYPTIEWESKVVTNLNAKVLQIMREQSSVRQKPTVYFSRSIDGDTIAYMVSLFQQRLGNRVAIKLHFGESGNKNFLKPELLKRLTQELNASLVDCNTAYEGSTRLNTADHIETAKRHGFTFGYVDILDADGELELSVPRRFIIQNELMEIANGKKPYECHVTPGRHLESIRVGSHIRNYDSLIVYTHFKGHTMAGFGGSIKNIGMGMASGANGKKQIHDDWCGGPLFLERLVESASAIESVFDNRTVYVNVLANLSLECDCDKDAPKPTMPDIGILVSDDIVAIEQASWDLIRYNYKNGEFLQQVSDKSGYHQIEYAKWLGMGSTQYNLRDLSNNLLKLESSKIASEPIKNITFPEEEIAVLKLQDQIITTRVSAEYNKWNVGDICRTPWGDLFKITDVKKFKDVGNHPYLKELTHEQIALIGKYKKISLVTMTKIDPKTITESTQIIQIDESKFISHLDSNFKSQDKMDLSLFKAIKIDKATYDKYKSQCDDLKHCDYKKDIAILFVDNEDNVVALLAVDPTDHGYHEKWITIIAVNKKYRGHGLSKQLLDYCVQQLKATALGVYKDNEVALKIYKDYGFKISPESQAEIDLGKSSQYRMYFKLPVQEVTDIQIDEWIQEAASRSSYRLYHISQDPNLDGTEFKPRIPKTRMITKGQENGNIPRVCFGPDIDHCIMAIIDYNHYKEFTDREYSVYVPESKHKEVSNREIVKNKYVSDANVTGESWIVEPVKIKKIGTIFITSEIKKEVNFTDCNGNQDHTRQFKWCWVDDNKKPVQEGWRAELPDKSFGIPEDRKFPLDSEQHVRSAIKLFGHAQEDKKKKLARRIASAAKKYNIDIPQSTQCYKYLHEATISQVIPEGIKNIIFDFGKVLVDVNLNRQIKQDKDIPSELADELIQQYFSILFVDDDSKLAHENDLLTIEQAKAKFDQSVPEHLKPYTDEVFKCVETSMSLYPHTLPILSALKAKGYRLFYLSNWPRFSFDSMAPYFAELIPNFEGGIISCDVGLLKPEREIYAKLLNDYGLLPEECLFFDDKQENLEPAEKFFGMKVYRFDYKETPQILMGELNLKPIELPNVENMIMVMPKPGDPDIDPNSQPKTLEISRFKNWILSKTPIDTDITPVNRNEFYMTLNIAVTVLTQEIANDPNEDKIFEQPYPYKRYVYVNQDALLHGKSEEIKLVYVGRIVIKNDGTYEWELQLPVYINGDGLLSSITQPTSTTEAMALASINPIMGWNNHLLINTGKQYVYTQDPDSEKGLIVNEDGILEVINTHNLPIKEMYRFVGNKGYIAKLAQAYKESAHVESLYSVLTGGKTLLTEDQFMFDESFSRVDFDLLEQRVISELATLKDEIIAVSNGNNKSWSTFNEFVNVEKPSFIDKYNTCGDISIREDFDGYYFYSDLNHKRSMSVPFVSMLTENMLNSIM